MLEPCISCGERHQLEVRLVSVTEPERDIVQCRKCRTRMTRGNWQATGVRTAAIREALRTALMNWDHFGFYDGDGAVYKKMRQLNEELGG